MQKKQLNQENEKTPDQEIEKQTEIKEDQEFLDFNNPDFSFIPKGFHGYRQQGSYLVCMTCELQHATYIGMERLMVGEMPDGTPILKKRSELYEE